MLGKDKFHSEEKRYGYKRRTKRAFILFEQKGKPDPIKFYFFAILFLLLGILASIFEQQRAEELRFINPIAINVNLVGATCSGQSGKQRPHMFRTYVYSPQQAGSYKTYDSIEYASVLDCKADLSNASAIFPRTHVWYDQSTPWDARWTLEEPSPLVPFWCCLPIVGIILFFGLWEQRRLNRYRGNNNASRG